MSIEFDKIFPLLVTSLVTILSWFILHRLNKFKERETKRKELIINYLIDAWQKLEYASHREDYDKILYLENPIATIQIFGTVEQIQLAQKFANDIALTRQASLTDLLLSLRQHLRKELNLEPVPESIKHLRFNNNSIELHSESCPQCNMLLKKGQTMCVCGYTKRK